MAGLELSETELQLARHALGLPNKRKMSYRNNFVTGSGSVDYAPWKSMVVKGAATCRMNVSWLGGDDIFHLTIAGAIAALAKGERLSPEDFPTRPTPPDEVA